MTTRPLADALRTLGRHGVEALVDRCCARATQMAELLAKDPRVQRDGTCWLAGTTWHNLAMRMRVVE